MVQVEVDKSEEEKVETVEMLSATCVELQSTVARQKKQLQSQRKQLADAREQMILLQSFADRCAAENQARPRITSPLGLGSCARA